MHQLHLLNSYNKSFDPSVNPASILQGWEVTKEYLVQENQCHFLAIHMLSYQDVHDEMVVLSGSAVALPM